MSNAEIKNDNFYKRRKRVLAALKNSTAFKEYVAFLKDKLENERQEYEMNVATEHARGRVSMLRSLIEELEQGN